MSSAQFVRGNYPACSVCITFPGEKAGPFQRSSCRKRGRNTVKKLVSTMTSRNFPSAKQTQGRSVHTGFKSPLMVRTTKVNPTHSGPSASPGQQSPTQSCDIGSHQQCTDAVDMKGMQRAVDDLTEQLREVEETIRQLRNEGLDESELADHIKKLHEYNEIKDTAQMVLGHIATLQGVRTRDLYPKYGLEVDD